MFKFKTPSKKTLKLMSEVAKGNNTINFEEKTIEKIQTLTTKENVKITSSGHNSIFIALSSIKGDIIIPNQGGWHGFKQIAKFLNKNIINLKTNLGIIKPDYLNELDIKENSALIYTSFAGYTAEQDIKSIQKYCKNNNITTIEDASAGIGDKKQLGKYSDIIISSTGSPKMINVGNGGFIASNNDELFKNTILPQKLSKTSQIICSGIYSELDNVCKNLKDTINATMYLKKHIHHAIHPNKRGVNVIILDENAKSKSWYLKEKINIDKNNLITTCPNYNRVKKKAICIEIKNLDYNCLKKENLKYIINIINNQQ